MVANDSDNNQLYVLLGKGDGTFLPPVILSGGGQDMALGDFNGDGKLDIATAGRPRVIIYPGNGDGTFGAGYTIQLPGDENSMHILVMDLNHDGKLDMVLSLVSNSGEFAVLLGKGDGTFQSQSTYTNPGGAFLPSLAVGDVNGDGFPDVVMGGENTIGVSLGKGDGTFLDATSFTTNKPYINGVAIADINGDGKADLIAAVAGDATSSFAILLLGNGDGTFGTSIDVPAGFGANSIAVGDFNRDTRPDMLTADPGSNSVSVLLNAGVCTYTVQFPFSGPVPGLGSYGSATVTPAQNYCAWTATSSDPSWLQVDPPANVGTGQVSISVQNNPLAVAREAVLTIANQSFTVTQSSTSCISSVSGPLFPVGTTAATIGSAGGQTSLTVSTNSPDCAWNAYGNPPLVTLNATEGTGTSSILITVPPNPSSYQVYAYFSVAGQEFEMMELGNGQSFSDVAPSDYYFDAVNLLFAKGITAGCSANPPMYCPSEAVTRAQMAIFLVRTILGTDSFPFSPTPYFSDVPAGSFGFQWIQKLKELSVTAGCGPNLYCPGATVSRDQMAVFIIRARYGSTAVFDYPQTPYFTDVPDSDFAFSWIQRLKEDAITSGCGPTIYCPGESVTRGDMAIFLMRGGFNQLLPALEPIITQVSPSTIPTGQTASVSITGLNTNFVQGSTIINPVDGFTLGALAVTSPTTLSVNVTAGPTSTLQPESVLVITGTEEAVLPNALVIP